MDTEIKSEEQLFKEAEERNKKREEKVTPTLTFFDEDNEAFTLILDESKLRAGNIMATRIIDKLGKEYSDREHPDIYFYCLLTLQERIKDIFSGLTKEQIKFIFD